MEKDKNIKVSNIKRHLKQREKTLISVSNFDGTFVNDVDGDSGCNGCSGSAGVEIDNSDEVDMWFNREVEEDEKEEEDEEEKEEEEEDGDEEVEKKEEEDEDEEEEKEYKKCFFRLNLLFFR